MYQPLDPEPSFARSVTNRIKTETLECVTTFLVLMISLALCFVSFLYCPICLLVLVCLCFTCCLCFPVLNIPLWLGVFLLVLGGFQFTQGNFHFIWSG